MARRIALHFLSSISSSLTKFSDVDFIELATELFGVDLFLHQCKI